MSNQHYTRWERAVSKRRKRYGSPKYIDGTSGVNMFGIIAEVDRKYRAWLRRRGLKDDEMGNFSFGKQEYVPDQQ